MGKSNIPKIDCLPSNLGKIHHQVWCTGRVKMTEVVNRTVPGGALPGKQCTDA